MPFRPLRPVEADVLTIDSARLDAVSNRAIRHQGALEQMRRQETGLVTSLLEARRIVDVKDEVTRTLEKLQEDANAKLVSAYNTLLTLLVQDIFGGSMSIRLSLHTERGLPALNIEGFQGDRLVDIYEGAGGSLTNVICLGLRSIAAAASGMRRFLCLDEADCWLRPSRVSDFYRVLNKLAEPNPDGQAGFQTLAISHHDRSLLDQTANIISLSGTPEIGVKTACNARLTDWDETMPGIRYIRLVNFAGFIDATMVLSPGVNYIIGDNNVGKSRVMKALRSVAYGESSDLDIRHGQKEVRVDIGLEHGMTLGWSRKPGRTPVQEWVLKDAAGDIMTVDGEYCQSGRRRKSADGGLVPPWATGALGIERRDGLDIHLTHQKRPVFLLEETPTRRASVLCVGREASRVLEMIAAHKKKGAEATQTLARGEIRLNALRETIRDIDTRLASVNEQLKKAACANNEALEARNRGIHAQELAHRLDAGRVRLSGHEKRAGILSTIPDMPDITMDMNAARDSMRLAVTIERRSSRVGMLENQAVILRELPATPVLPDGRSPALAAQRIETAQHGIRLHERVLAILTALPDGPVLDRVEQIDAATQCIEVSRQKLRDTKTRLAQGERELDACNAAISTLLKDTGNTCPLCGTHGIEGLCA